MVVTTTLTIKFWLKDMPMSQAKPNDLSMVALTFSILKSQLVAILFVTILINLSITHYQTIAGLWILMAACLSMVCIFANFGEFNTSDLSLRKLPTSIQPIIPQLLIFWSLAKKWSIKGLMEV